MRVLFGRDARTSVGSDPTAQINQAAVGPGGRARQAALPVQARLRPGSAQWWAAAFLPEILGDTYRLALHLHQRAIFRMLRSSRAHPQGNGGSSVDKFY